MSTVALWSADAAPPDVMPNARPSLFQRLIVTREKATRRRIRQFLVMQPDERLLALGYTAEDIQALRLR